VTVRREIGFDAEVLHAAEREAAARGDDLSAYVNAAVRRALSPPGGAADAATCRPAFGAALAAHDARAARAAVEAALAAGLPILDLYVDVLTPVLHEVGHRWAVEDRGVTEEHFTTAVVQSLLPALAASGRRKPTDGRLAVVACTPGELHGIASQMVADLLERDGWEVLALGASTPAADLAALVARECPDLVALSTSTAGRLPGLAEVLGALGSVAPRPLVVTGGGLFTETGAATARELGADLVVSDLRGFLAAVRERFPVTAR
jgi:methanogenic corrinoid protein MtbC1